MARSRAKKRRKSAGESKTARARDAAFKVLSKRSTIRTLKAKRDLEGLTEAEESRLEQFVMEVRSLKALIAEWGFDPLTTISTAAASLRKPPTKRKTLRGVIKAKRRSGGVGMYGLGASPKMWR